MIRKWFILPGAFLSACGALVAADEAVPRVGPTFAEIAAMTPAAADAHLPVRTRVVVLYCEPQWRLTFLHDGTRGLFSVASPEERLEPGDELIVSGVTTAGRTVAMIGGAEGGFVMLEKSGRAPLPVPRPMSAAEFADPRNHSDWAVVEARVGEVRERSQRAILELEIDGLEATAILPNFPNSARLPVFLKNTRVRLTGMPGSMMRRSGIYSELVLRVPGLAQVEMLPETLEQRFSGPVLDFESLRTSYNLKDPVLVRTLGRVVLTEPGLGFFLLVDGHPEHTGTWVATSQPGELSAGQEVEVSAVSDSIRGMPLLREALFRPGAAGPASFAPLREAALKAVPPSEGDQRMEARHGSLVRVAGTVLSQSSDAGEETLLLGTADGMVSAQLSRRQGSPVLPRLAVGSTVEAAGVWISLPMAEFPILRPAVAQLRLWDSREVRLLQAPSWWTVPRLLTLGGGGLALGILVLAWAFALRRQVRRQTAIIGEQVQRDAVHSERRRIARDLHDTLEQHLSGIGIQLDAAATRVGVDDGETQRLISLARRMTRHSREEARETIWDLRVTPEQVADVAVELEKELAPRAQEAGLVWEIRTRGAGRPVPGLVALHLQRFAHEALTNVIKHAGATRVLVTVAYSGDGLTISVRDDGCGLPVDRTGGAGGFGLSGMEERANRLGGKFSLESTPGGGVSVSIHAPVGILPPTRYHEPPLLTILL